MPLRELLPLDDHTAQWSVEYDGPGGRHGSPCVWPKRPGRKRYCAAMADADCIFCKIMAGDLPSFKVDEDERTYSFLDISPATPGHLLVVPKQHYADLLTIAVDDLVACTLTAQRLAGRVMTRLGADGVNLLNACGAQAGQTVFHFHLHVVPRYADGRKDSLRLPWEPTPGDMNLLAAIATELSA